MVGILETLHGLKEATGVTRPDLYSYPNYAAWISIHTPMIGK